MIRRMLEVLLADWRVTRRLPASLGGGRFRACSGVGGLKYVFKSADQLDPGLLDAARRLVRPGDVVWDVGANVGLFSTAACHLAGAVGKVYSFEADIDAVSLLLETRGMRAASDAPMEVVPIAISEQTGFTPFNIVKRARAANSMVGFGYAQSGGGTREVRMVPSFSLDTLVAHFASPRLLKIDVEGAEVVVLRGARELLAKVRPVVFCEVASEHAQEVAALLRQADYLLWSGQDLEWSAANAREGASWDTVAVPREKVAEYAAPARPHQ